eukprot:CAMPEP_0170620080 /NCGR_PEP_ID=MMETSP0224-20130122/27868_1 /TAXON_ID=285029 /ORGANISM="Togula jolla, Strain CCCM 725" /LENGTH=62 /DNA_ID=CAMNT_0010946231 /DNA_START=371 /DNA_END=559 /DNA_ORIENTATION=-
MTPLRRVMYGGAEVAVALSHVRGPLLQQLLNDVQVPIEGSYHERRRPALVPGICGRLQLYEL